MCCSQPRTHPDASACAEKSLDVHSRSVLRRVEGPGGLLLLTAQEIIHIPTTVCTHLALRCRLGSYVCLVCLLTEVCCVSGLCHRCARAADEDADDDEGGPSGVVRVHLDRVVGVEREGSDVEVAALACSARRDAVRLACLC
eukprot:3913337-Rhodomonas_salina.6